MLLELTSFGSAGFLELEAQSTWQFELGSRGGAGRTSWDLAVFQANVEDEILNINVRPFPNAPFTVPSYRNTDKTVHRGVEAGVAGSFNTTVSARLAYTYSDFHYVDDPAYGDNDLPGAAPHLIRAELRFELPRKSWIAPNIDWSPSRYAVDSINTNYNNPYLVLNTRAGTSWNTLELFVEGTNLTAEEYSASVQVDTATGRFFEPSSPRSFVAGLRWAMERP